MSPHLKRIAGMYAFLMPGNSVIVCMCTFVGRTGAQAYGHCTNRTHLRLKQRRLSYCWLLGVSCQAGVMMHVPQPDQLQAHVIRCLVVLLWWPHQSVVGDAPAAFWHTVMSVTVWLTLLHVPGTELRLSIDPGHAASSLNAAVGSAVH